MFCRNCGKEVDANAVACMGCGCSPRAGNKFCANCGAEIGEGQVVCVKCGVALTSASLSGGAVSTKSRMVYVLLAILPPLLCCQFPFHSFYLGRMNMAIVQTIVWVVSILLGILTGGITVCVTWPLTLAWYIVEACTVKTDPNGAPLK